MTAPVQEQAENAAANGIQLDAETAAAYVAVFDAARALADSLGVKPDEALEWDYDALSGESVCLGFGYGLLDQIRALHEALWPFDFGYVKELRTKVTP